MGARSDGCGGGVVTAEAPKLAAVMLSECIATLRLRWLLEAHDRAVKSARDLVSSAAMLLRQLQPPVIVAPSSCPAIRHRGGHAQHRRAALKRRNIIRNRRAQR